ncbi:MAG: zinc ribbon domain-containing protein [Rhodanobacter sp.]|jgi:hypothetical protein|nr:zinc ribbon domain-containing protein [Rhodanobacter sp.]
MLYIWGSGGGSAIAGDAGMHNCPICNSAQRFDIVVNYRYRHFWYILSWVSKREYSLVCSRCHNGMPATKEQYAGRLSDKDPIPFMRRRGWLVGVGGFAVLLALGAYASNEDAKQMVERAAAPQVGDVYLADLSKISDSLKDSPVYGAMKLTRIDNGNEQFVIAHSGYGRKRDMRKDISSGRVKNDSYYDADDTVDLTSARVTELTHQGVIYEIVR